MRNENACIQTTGPYNITFSNYTINLVIINHESVYFLIDIKALLSLTFLDGLDDFTLKQSQKKHSILLTCGTHYLPYEFH